MRNINNNQQYHPSRITPQNNQNLINANSNTHTSEDNVSITATTSNRRFELRDYGPNPFVVNISDVTEQNSNFRTALWTGSYLQLTLMSIPVGGEIGLESHPDVDQFIRIEEGQGLLMMGDRKDNLNIQEKVYEDYAFIIPAGTWHNLVNKGNEPIKLYSIYAPPNHPFGTIHKTKEEADAQEHASNAVYKSENVLLNRLYGVEAAKADKEPTVENMLLYAIQDEYLARARCHVAIDKFGHHRSFTNILRAEEIHISYYLMPLLAKYKLDTPLDESINYIKEPSDIKAFLEEGIESKKDSIDMYERFLAINIPNDVKAVFSQLKNASGNHLQVLRRVLSLY